MGFGCSPQSGAYESALKLERSIGCVFQNDPNHSVEDALTISQETLSDFHKGPKRVFLKGSYLVFFETVLATLKRDLKYVSKESFHARAEKSRKS